MANKETKRLGNKGFSLVELIVVIAIMAVLVGVLAPQFIRYVEKSRQSGDVTSIQSAMSVIETGVSDDVIKGEKVVITITAGADAKITVTGTGATLGTALTDSGLKEDIDLKSTGWKGMTIEYSIADFKWTINGADTKNGNKPNLDMKTVINESTPAAGN